MSNLANVVSDLVRQGFDHTFGQADHAAAPDPVWRKIRDAGSTLWLDTGDIEAARAIWNEEFEALTTNNTLLNNEIQKGLYDDLVTEAADRIRAASPDIDDKSLVLEIAFVLNAFHGLRLVETFDARVSVELHTDLADDVERSVDYGKRYFSICPERFIVKVPLTAAGLLAARKLVQAGVPINFTLGFSVRQNYLAALLTQPDYVNVFLGRLNSFVADHELGTGEWVGEKVTLATQRALAALRESGRSSTQLIAASIRSGQQVGDLAGVDVHTIPPKAASEYRDAPASNPVSRVDQDPDVPLSEGVTPELFNAASLWDLPDAFVRAVDDLLAKSLDDIGPVELQAHFEDSGIHGFLPAWSGDEQATIRADGKIPVLARWQERLVDGSLGLDALMNMSALQAFTADQEKLDARIRSLLVPAA
jgi:transaldolase